MTPDLTIDSQKFILIFFRVVSILWLLPLFSSTFVSVTYKAGFSLVVSFFLFDLVKIDQGLTSDTYYMALAIAKEVFLGLTISFFVRILFTAIYAAGEISAMQTGFAFARFMDPNTMAYTSVLEQLQNVLTVIIFFAIDAHHALIKAMFLSFRELPLGAVALNSSLLQYMVNVFGRIFSVGLRIGAPLIVTLFIVELALGLLSRMIPQVNIFVEGMPLKIIITFMILSFSLSVTVSGIANLFRGIDGEILKMIRLMV